MPKNRPKRPLRACHIYYSKFKINAVLIREAKAMADIGFEVDIICLREKPGDPAFQKLDGLNIYCIQAREEREKKATLYFYRVIMFFLKAFLMVSIMGLYKRYKVVHVTSPPDIMIFAAAVPKLLGAKMILDIHDIGPELFMRKLNILENRKVISLIKLMEKISCSFADHVITVTDPLRERLINRGIAPSKCSVLLNVPDEELFNRRGAPPRHQTNGSGPSLYYHGTLDEHFGVDTLVEAMPEIRAAVPGARLHIYGSGRIMQDLITMAQTLKIGDCVTFHGTVPFYDLPKILWNADIGIVPTKKSTFAEDVLAMKSLEYIAMGIPIVISRTKNHDYYYNNSMVKFFEPEDVHDLAVSVIDLCRDDNMRRQLAENANTFISRIGWSKTKEIYLGIVRDLMFGKQKPPCKREA